MESDTHTYAFSEPEPGDEGDDDDKGEEGGENF